MDENINCNIQCFPILKVFNSCPTRDLSLMLLFNGDLNDFLEIIYVILSTTPYILSFTFLTYLILYKTSRLFFIVVMCFMQNFIVEILKNSIKDPRPNYKCNKTFGNPSNHAVFFSSLSFWILMEVINLEKKFQYSNLKNKVMLIIFTPLILFARYKLKYHTIEQLVNGVIVGAFIGILWFIISEKLFLNRENTFSLILSKLNILNNMSSYEIFPTIDNSKSFKTYKKFNELLLKQEELVKMKKQINDFKNTVEKIDCLKEETQDYDDIMPPSNLGNENDLMEIDNYLKLQINKKEHETNPIKSTNKDKNALINIKKYGEIGNINNENIKEYLSKTKKEKLE